MNAFGSLGIFFYANLDDILTLPKWKAATNTTHGDAVFWTILSFLMRRFRLSSPISVTKMADDLLLPQVRKALKRDGWKLGTKAFSLRESGFQFWVDVVAEKDGQKVLVEVKSWLNTFSADWYQALGQYLTYQDVVSRKAQDHELYLAVPEAVYNEHFTSPLIQNMVTKNLIKILIFNPTTNEVISWKR